MSRLGHLFLRRPKTRILDMSSPSEEENRLQALLQQNADPSEPSKEELRLVALHAAFHDPSGLGVAAAAVPPAPPGSVAEDFVELSLPEFSGNSVRSGSQASDVVSPMMSMASVTSGGVSRGGAFMRSPGSKFSVVVVLRDKAFVLRTSEMEESFV